MDRPFLTLMCDSFYDDAHLYNSKIWTNKTEAINELKSEMFTLMDNVKLEDKPFYIALHENLNRIQQQKIIYLLLSEYVMQKFGGKSIFEEVDLTSFETPEQFLLSESASFLGGLSSIFTGADSIVGGASTAAGGALQSATAVASGLGFTGSLAGVLGGLILAITMYKGLSRVGWASLTALNKINIHISDFIHHLTRSGKVKRAIFHVNADECYRRCNIDPQDLSRWVGLALSGKIFSTPKSREQSGCLSICYLNWNLKQVEVLASSYKECLINTGERSDQMNDLSVFLQSPASTVCQAYYNLLKQHYDAFKDAVEVIFRQNTGDIELWMRKYKDILNNALSTKSKINPLDRSPEKKDDRQQRPQSNQQQRQGYRYDQQGKGK